MRQIGFLVLTCFVIIVGHIGVAIAQIKQNDMNALFGGTVGKVMWDISMSNPETPALYLSVVQKTYNDLILQNVKPKMVLAVHGAPVRYLHKDISNLPFDSLHHIEKINEILDDMRVRPGVRIEVCSVANRLLGVNDADIRDGLHVVGNTWISLIGYLAQGYAVIPIQ